METQLLENQPDGHKDLRTDTCVCMLLFLTKHKLLALIFFSAITIRPEVEAILLHLQKHTVPYINIDHASGTLNTCYFCCYIFQLWPGPRVFGVWGQNEVLLLLLHTTSIQKILKRVTFRKLPVILCKIAQPKKKSIT